jgi:hypothetical protein
VRCGIFGCGERLECCSEDFTVQSREDKERAWRRKNLVEKLR